jgi:hypothetical protein
VDFPAHERTKTGRKEHPKTIKESPDMIKSMTYSGFPFFFIIGRPRSGTTLLRTLFDAHPQVCIPLEAPIIKHLAPKYAHITDWTEKKLEEFYHDVIHIWKFNTWTIDNEALNAAVLSQIGKCDFHTLINIVYLHYQSFFDKEEIRIIGDKNPSYSTCTRKILRLYPEAKYVHLTRDHRDNILSILKVDFEAPHIPLIAYRWRYSAKRIQKLKEKYPTQFYSLQYEELVKEPENELRKMCQFLELDYKADMLNFYEKKDEVMARIPEDKFNKYHSSLFQPINPKKVYAWKNTMDEKKVKQADLVVGKYAEIQGYERKYTRFSLFDYLRVVPGMLYGRLSYIITVFIDLLPFGLRMKIRNKGSVLAALYWSVHRLRKKQ